MADVKFIDGMFVNPPHEKAPDFVKAGISFRREQFIEWLNQQEPNEKGYIRIQVKESREGKYYAALDDYKPTSKQDSHNQAKADGYAPPKAEFVDSDIPF